ncbi:sulfatase [Thalassotalea crassostreae]|uniref:sulfatase family protein n=1 Tax=Thalassotalea crassostreae TaxID=1763536 RepID=UPI0008396A42|nr:sulfatase [Thalassotalea crassostreae]
MNKYKILTPCLVFALLLVNNIAISAEESEVSRPNIVMIVADDHGLDAIGAYGNKVIKTPNLDALAANGVRFNKAFATVSSCSSSRSVMLTGLQNHANGMYGLQHEKHHFSSLDTVKSLPVLLSNGGYKTARIGKYHLAPEHVYRFDTVLSKGAANDMASIARSPVEMANISKSFIKDTQQPFFLFYASDDPHRAYPFETFPEPNGFGNRKQGYPGITEVLYTPEEVIVPPYLPDTLAARKEIAQYYQSVSRLDQGVGRLIEVLKETGKYDNTIILYLSDNGIAFPGAKTNLYDPGIQLPLIVKAPKNNKIGKSLNEMISWTDLTPTLLDYAGLLTSTDKYHGKSFRPLIEKSAIDSSEWNEVYASHTFHEVMMYYPIRMVRTQQYKLLWNIAYKLDYPSTHDLQESLIWQETMRSNQTQYGPRSLDDFFHRAEFELYDVVNDPLELTNLANEEEHQQILERLINKIKSFQKNTDDPWVRKWRYK